MLEVQEEKMTKRKKMARPTEKEVALRMMDLYVRTDVAVTESAKFMGYWESRDWARGAEPMRSWRGSVQSWVNNLDRGMFTGEGVMDRSAKIDQLKREHAEAQK